MDSSFIGSWKLDPSKNVGMEAFGKAMGLPPDQVENYNKLSYVVTMTQDGEKFTVSVDFAGAMPNRSYTMKLGETIDYNSAAGVTAKLTVTMDNGKVLETYENEEKKTKWTVQRSVAGNEMTAVTKLGDATLTQVLIKV
ncbi:fatty acid-binding protein [Plakobranchus ocellatus]|uniref:Fatty acid-binding protein n=1 Tax=Plakobranchus ocellatus TaxID=259542 RepID=A0AAV4DZU8_9GAST|nr:fatty acid-binding protein [Plakobranchus ocellatus]